MGGIQEAAEAFHENIVAGEKGGDEIERLPTGRDDTPENEDGRDPTEVSDDEEVGESEESEEEDSEDSEDEEGDEEADEAESQLDLEAKVKVTVDGEQTEVPLKEAIDGYIRQETFHRRLNQVRDVALELNGIRQEVNNDRARYVQGLAVLEDQLQSLTPREPDWATEFQKDPVAAGQLRVQWDEYNKQVAAIRQERERVLMEQERIQQHSFQSWVQEQQRQMLNDNPEWNDQKQWDADKKAMAKVALEAGYSQEEINQIFDARQLKILKMAAKYARIQANKPKPGDSKTISKPGRRSDGGASRTPPKSVPRNVAERLARTGSTRDAAALFENILARED
jgi:hypothetical protein